jgi:predicted pyridoxine 5'-phosphate oxidase superfamily flavin-nucleotide-binding protein
MDGPARRRRGTPPLAIVIDVAEVFYHCVKGLRRAGVWDPDLWIPDAAPSRKRVAAS